MTVENMNQTRAGRVLIRAATLLSTAEDLDAARALALSCMTAALHACATTASVATHVGRGRARGSFRVDVQATWHREDALQLAIASGGYE